MLMLLRLKVKFLTWNLLCRLYQRKLIDLMNSNVNYLVSNKSTLQLLISKILKPISFSSFSMIEMLKDWRSCKTKLVLPKIKLISWRKWEVLSYLSLRKLWMLVKRMVLLRKVMILKSSIWRFRKSKKTQRTQVAKDWSGKSKKFWELGKMKMKMTMMLLPNLLV